MNQCTIIGNLTGNPELRTTKAGKTVCNFSVAVNRREKKEDGTNVADYFRVTTWNEQAKSCGQYLAKGRKVAVTGSVSVDTYTAQDGTTRASLELMAQNVEFLSPKGDSNSAPAQAAPAPSIAPAQATPVLTDDLPF